MAEKIHEKIIAQNLSNLMKNSTMHIQKAQRIPSRIYPSRFTPRHAIIKLLIPKEMVAKEGILTATWNK